MAKQKPIFFRDPRPIKKLVNNPIAVGFAVFMALFFLFPVSEGTNYFWRNGMWRVTETIALVVLIPASLCVVALLVISIRYCIATFANRKDWFYFKTTRATPQVMLKYHSSHSYICTS